MTPTAAIPFYGWYRPNKRQRWQKLAEAPDCGDCLGQLLEAAAKLPGHAELLASQTDPNGKGRRTQRESLFA